jgi:ribonucleoside-diphosphate reductase alpha chain
MAVGDTCRLIATNMFCFVVNPFTSEAHIDEEKVYKVFYLQQRMGDNLVDLEIEYAQRIIKKIKKDKQPDYIKLPELMLWQQVIDKAERGRRTGNGITALGDMIAALNLKYDSEEGLAVVQKVMSIKMKAELDCSVDLAILRGPFKDWDYKKEFTETKDFAPKGLNSFYQMLVEEFPEQVLRMIKYGRRNVNWSTIAPTGTTSLMTQSTSGCEPLFMGYYMRRKKINPSEQGMRIDFTDQNGDTWQEFAILHPKFEMWLGIQGLSKQQIIDLTQDETKEYFEKSLWFGSTANDINWLKRVEMQGILQKYTTSAISSTLNLPNTVTKEEVDEIYRAGYKLGLKGVTIYRDGSRTGVLVAETTKENKEQFAYKDAPKRPDVLICDIFNITARGKKWSVVVGLYENKPYEVFAIERDATEIPEKLKRGTLAKEGKGKYTLVAEQYTIKDVTAGMTDEEESLTRMISTALRHGASIDFIVDQLNKSHGTVVSFNKAISRVLSKYAKALSNKKITCNDCGGENVVFEEGCLKCYDCGSAKCG